MRKLVKRCELGIICRELREPYLKLFGTCFICSRRNRYITEFTAEAEVFAAREDLASAEMHYSNV